MISFDKLKLSSEEINLVNKCLINGKISIGEYGVNFEKEVCKFCGVAYGSAVTTGTAALHIALSSFGIGKGDEVIVPSFTFIASANSIAYTGAKPVFVDSEQRTFCLDYNAVKNHVNKRTKAIMAVHIYGYPCDMDKISEIARENNLFLIEDASEALGCTYKGKSVGTFSDIACFSFSSDKIITTGEGGMCLTKSKNIKERIDLLRSQGKKKSELLKDGEEYAKMRYYHELLGFNYRMTNIQAAIGIGQIKKIKKVLKIKSENAKIYSSKLRDIAEIFIREDKNYAKCNYWVYPVLLDNGKKQVLVANELKKINIPTRSFFYPCHLQPFYNAKVRLKVAEGIWQRGLVLPNSIFMSKDEVKYVCECVVDILNKYG